MLDMTKFLVFAIIAVSLFEPQVFAEKKSASSPTMSLDFLYKGGKANFGNLQVKVSAYGRSLFFDSFEGHRFALNCTQDTASQFKWSCSNACESGTVTINFTPRKGFSEFVIEKLAVRPRHCDGSEGETDLWVSSGTPMTFSLSETKRNYRKPTKLNPIPRVVKKKKKKKK